MDQTYEKPAEHLNTGQPKITGYRNLSQAELDAINESKRIENEVGTFVTSLEQPQPGLGVEGSFLADQRWRAIARTLLQQGFMALNRSITKPDSQL